MNGRWVLGVDIGGTNLVVAAIPVEGGAPAAIRSHRTLPGRGADAAVADIGVMAEEVITEVLDHSGGDRSDVIGVGIGCPGPLELREGVIITTPNLGWGGYPIRDRIADTLSLPATLDNDANCATYAEWWLEIGRAHV